MYHHGYNTNKEGFYRERKGKFLTHEEKKRLKEYAQEQRKKKRK